MRNLAARGVPEQELGRAGVLEWMSRRLDELERWAAGRDGEFIASCRRTYIEGLSIFD